MKAIIASFYCNHMHNAYITKRSIKAGRKSSSGKSSDNNIRKCLNSQDRSKGCIKDKTGCVS